MQGRREKNQGNNGLALGGSLPASASKKRKRGRGERNPSIHLGGKRPISFRSSRPGNFRRCERRKKGKQRTGLTHVDSIERKKKEEEEKRVNSYILRYF